MLDRFRQHVGGLVGIAGEAAGDEVGARGERDHQRMERPHFGAARRQRGVEFGLRGGRRLALGHAVDVVVHDDVGHVDIAPAGVQEMVAADRIAVAVAAGDDNGQIRPRHFQAGGERQRAAVDAVKAVAIGIGGDARRAADARHHADLFRRQAELREGAAERHQHVIVAAAGTPDRLHVGFVIRLLVDARFDVHGTLQSAIAR